MENQEEFTNTFRDSITIINADNRKARTVSSILEKAEEGDEEENKGRS